MQLKIMRACNLQLSLLRKRGQRLDRSNPGMPTSEAATRLKGRDKAQGPSGLRSLGSDVLRRLQCLLHRLEALDASTTEARAAQLLHGLGFTKTMQQKRTGDFSGGWRMRIALARALFVDPTFLILDGEPSGPARPGCLYRH